MQRKSGVEGRLLQEQVSDDGKGLAIFGRYLYGRRTNDGRGRGTWRVILFGVCTRLSVVKKKSQTR